MAPFDRSLYTTSYWSVIVSIALSRTILETKRDIGRKAQCFMPPAFGTTVIGSPSQCHNVWYGKTRMAWLPDCKKVLWYGMFIAVST